MSKVKNKFATILKMEDKEEAARLVVKNAIKYVQKNGWESTGWSGSSGSVCLVGALLEGAGVPVHEEDGAPACSLDGKLISYEEDSYYTKSCNSDELLFKKLPNLKNAAYKVLNEHLDAFIDEKKKEVSKTDIKIKSLKLKQDKKGEDYYEFEIDDLKSEKEDIKADISNFKGHKVTKNASANTISSAIQGFNDEILEDENKAVKFLKDILAEFKDPYAKKKSKPSPAKVATKAIKKVVEKKEWFDELKTVPNVPQKQEQTVSVSLNDSTSRFSNLEID